MQKSEIVVSCHDKSEQEIYRRIPPILKALLNKYPQLDGFVIGGSYASGSYQNGDDIDIDLLYPSYPDILNKQRLEEDIHLRFQLNQLKAHIRAPLAASTLPEHMRRSMYERHPETPFVVRNQNVAAIWGLVSQS
jgi:predicted nucleotidyltransferase